MGFPGGSVGKASTCSAGHRGSIPGMGRSPGEGNVYPLQYSGLENSMDYTVHRVSKSRTGLSDFHFHFPGFLPLAQVVGPIPTPSSAWYIPRCIFASPVAYLLVKDSNMRQLYSKETRIRDKVRRQEEIRDPYHACFSSFTQESHIAPHMRVCRQEHLGNWQMPLTCRVLPPPFLEVIPADLLVGSNFCPIYSGNTHLSAQTQGHSL